MSSDEEDDYPVTNNATAQNTVAPESTIRNLEAEQGYSEDDEEDEPINDAGRESRVADRSAGVAAEDVVSILAVGPLSFVLETHPGFSSQDDDDAEQASPQARITTNDNDDEDDEDEDDGPAARQPAPERSPRPHNDDDEDEEDDEDEDDEEDDEEDEEEGEFVWPRNFNDSQGRIWILKLDRPADSRGKKRKHKKRRINRFIDIEAEVDDEEEDEDEEEDFGAAGK